MDQEDQEQGGGARGSESWTSFASVVTQQQCYGHCPCVTLLGIAVETAVV